MKAAKKYIAMMLIMIMCLAPISARAQQRNWWPSQVDESDEYYDFQKVGEWPGTVVTNETAKDVIVFRPKVVAAQKFSKSVKVIVDATTSAKNIIVRYSVDGKTWTPQSYRNVGYKGPVICTRKWQCVLHKDDTNSSWCARQFTQGKASIDFKKTYHARDYMAQLYFDDHLIDHTVRPKVVCAVMLNIPAKAKYVNIRYAYEGFTKPLYSEWAEMRVR